MMDELEARSAQPRQRFQIGTPVCEQVKLLALCGFAKNRHHVGERAISVGKQPADNLSPEPAEAPAGRYEDDPSNLGRASALEIDDGRSNAAGEPVPSLSVQTRRANGRLFPSGQDRPGSNKILVHAAILAWTSANWVAHNPPPI